MSGSHSTTAPSGPNPSGLCMCGCGQKTELAKQTRRERGDVMGHPVRFVIGHSHGIPLALVIADPNPDGKCQCGCGQPTAVITVASRKLGHVVGQHTRFLPGHNFHTGPLIERFWAKAERRGPDECWPWHGARGTRGTPGEAYGSIWCNGRRRRASQVSWEIAHNKPFPDGLFACHTCDNGNCVNPSHIFPGTHAVNMRDMVGKGRAAGTPGAAHNSAKLTEDDVMAIRKRRIAGETAAELALAYPVRVEQIRRIVSRSAWRHLPQPEVEG